MKCLLKSSLSTCGLLAMGFFSALAAGNAAAQQEVELKSGLKIPLESVKAAGDGFTATVSRGAGVQTINFQAKDIARANFREPKELVEARNLIANQRPKVALERLEAVESQLLPFRSLPNNWWVRSALTRMDALAESGRVKDALAVANLPSVSSLSSEDAELLKNFQTILTPPEGSPDDKVESLKGLSKILVDSWLAARIWLEIGNTLSSQGKLEEAIGAWLRVAVFFPAEKDLAVRGTILAARGLQQIKAPQDGLKLLDDYLSDQLTTPFKNTIDAERSKLDPKAVVAATGVEAPTEGNGSEQTTPVEEAPEETPPTTQEN